MWCVLYFILFYFIVSLVSCIVIEHWAGWTPTRARTWWAGLIGWPRWQGPAVESGSGWSAHAVVWCRGVERFWWGEGVAGGLVRGLIGWCAGWLMRWLSGWIVGWAVGDVLSSARPRACHTAIQPVGEKIKHQIELTNLISNLI